MGIGFDLWYKPEADICPFTKPLGRFLDKRKLVKRIDLDRVDLRVDRIFNFPDLLARAVENYLVAVEADLQCLPQLTAGVDLDVDAGIFYRFQDPHCRHRFRRVTELERTGNIFPRFFDPVDVVPYA